MGVPRQIETGSGISLEYKGRLLYSRTEPARRPVRIAQSTLLRSETLYILPSPLLFYGVSELLHNLPESSFLLCLEGEEDLCPLTETQFVQAALPAASVGLLTAPSEAELLTCIRSLPQWPFRRVERLIVSGGYPIQRHYYDSLISAADAAIRITYQDMLTKVYFARRWIKNLFTNLSSQGQLPTYRYLHTEKTVVVAGAGESLETALLKIKAVREEIFLLAVDTALPALAEEGLVPDAVIVLESQFINIRDFYGTRTDRITLVADLCGYPAALRLPWKNKFFFLSSFASLRFFDTVAAPFLREYFFPAYGSVGVAAVALASAISSKPVYCAGLDFAYKLGKSHARGTQFIIDQLAGAGRTTPAGSYAPFIKRPLLTIEGKHGPVLTDLILLNYLTPLKRVIDVGGNIFDLNEAGLDIGAPFAREITHFSGMLSGDADRAVPESCMHNWNEFITAEYAALNELYTAGYNFLRTGIYTNDFAEKLQLRDYLCAHFPDSHVDTRSPAYIKRILVSIDGYRGHLKDLIQRIET